MLGSRREKDGEEAISDRRPKMLQCGIPRCREYRIFFMWEEWLLARMVPLS